MKSRLISCFDFRKLEVPKNLGLWRYSDKIIEDELEAISKEYSGEREVSKVEKGDNVRCYCVDSSNTNWIGRIFLIYPGLELPGAEEVEKVIIDKNVGDEFSCNIKTHHITLKIQNIVRKSILTINDELITLLNLPNVNNISEYYEWYHMTHDKEYKDKACIRIAQFWLEEIMKQSEFYIDESEKEEWCLHNANQTYEGLLAADVDVRKQSDGSVISKEEAIQQLKENQERYFVPYLIYTYFSSQAGYELTNELFESEVKKLAKERGESFEELIKIADLNNFKYAKYQEKAFHILMSEAEKFLEV